MACSCCRFTDLDCCFGFGRQGCWPCDCQLRSCRKSCGVSRSELSVIPEHVASMNEENSRYLCSAYPELYGDQFAFACPDSWVPLLADFSKALLERIRATGLTVTITDVKEKHDE